MPRPELIDRPTRNPGKCILTGAGDGPVIDTHVDFGDYGPRDRIYIRVEALASLFEQLGWARPEDYEKECRATDDVRAQLYEATEELAKLRPLKEALEPFIETRVEVKETTVQRPPTPDEIAAYLDTHPELTRAERRPAPGSREEWVALYGPNGPRTAAQKAKDEQEKRRKVAAANRAVARTGSVHNEPVEPDSEPVGESDPTSPPQVVELHGQDVDLDDLLDNPVKDVVKFAEGHPQQFKDAVIARETWRKAQEEKSPRVTLVKGLTEDEESDDE